ncbi:hypothetical protein MHU86_9984 [Fragilaria crotonensis]|nr:hypothetical protein MHU86_9984 [Fragilaria crotonensis]
MQVASRFTKSEAQLKAEQLSQTVATPEPQDDPLLQRAKEVMAENWEAPPSRDKVSEAMAILRTQRSARSSASKTSSIQTSLRAQSLKSKRPSEVDDSGVIANDEPNALHQTRSPLTLTSSTISGIGLNRGVLSPANSHISIQHKESLSSPVNEPRKPSRINTSASSHLSPTSTTTPTSPNKKSFFKSAFESRADGNELLPSSIDVPSSDGDAEDKRCTPHDARDEAETMRSGTPVFSNTTSRGAKESPNDGHLVTEIDAYYGCQSSDNELPDMGPVVSSPVKSPVARAVNFTGIQRQERPPPSTLTLLAPALEAFFDKFFFPTSGGSNNRFSIASRLEDSKHENKENDSHIESDVPTAPCREDIDATDIDAYYKRESLSSSDLKYDEQNHANSDSTVEEESSGGNRSTENSVVSESEMDDYYGHGSADSDAQSLELLKDMVFDRIAQKDSYGEVEERMLNDEMHTALTITPNSSTISRRGPAATNGSYDQSYSSEMSTEVEDTVRNHDDPVIRSFSDRGSSDEDRSSSRNGSRNRSQSSGTSTEVDGTLQIHDDPVIRSFSDRESTDEDRPSPRKASRVRTPSSGPSPRGDDTVQHHDDPVIRSFSDGGSSDEDRSSQRNGSSIRSQSTGTSTHVDDIAQVHDDPVIRSFSDRGSGDEDGQAPTRGDSFCSQWTETFTQVDDIAQAHDDPVIRSLSDRGSSDEDGHSPTEVNSISSHSSVMPVEVNGIDEQRDDIAEDESLDPVIQSFSDMQSIDEDDNILSYLERIEASKSTHSEVEFVEVVRMSPPVTVPESQGEQITQPTASPPPVSDDDWC